MTVPEFRNACHDFADKFVKLQMSQFKRLGVLGEWNDPYLTMSPDFEAREIQVFGEMFKKGYIYKGLKPVYWCPHDETALAELKLITKMLIVHLFMSSLSCQMILEAISLLL